MKIILNKKDLEKLYYEDKLSIRDLASLLKCNPKTVCSLMNRYGVKGRKRHSDRTIDKIRNANKGFKNSEEAKRKMSVSHMGLKQSPETIAKRLAHRAWYSHSEETRVKIGKGNIGKLVTDGTKEKLRISHLGHITSEEAKIKLSLALKGEKNHRYGIHMSQESKYKLSLSKKNKFKDIEYKNRILRAALIGNSRKPNKPETFIQSLLDKMYPNEYKYVGDGSVMVGGKSPDFMNTNKKKIILFHGIYWHLVKFQKTNPNLTKQQVESNDIIPFNNNGFDTLIIWEDEIMDINTLLLKISLFHKRVVAIGEKPITICEAESASGVLPKIGGDMIV